jgi:hypothetical protein
MAATIVVVVLVVVVIVVLVVVVVVVLVVVVVVVLVVVVVVVERGPRRDTLGAGLKIAITASPPRCGIYFREASHVLCFCGIERRG